VFVDIVRQKKKNKIKVLSVTKGNEMSIDEAKKEFIKLGYSEKEATKLATVALSYNEIGTQFDSVEDATKWLVEATISSLKYQDEEEQRMIDIIDKLNEVDYGSRISNEDIKIAIDKLGLND
jgi:hypothetical protein